MGRGGGRAQPTRRNPFRSIVVRGVKMVCAVEEVAADRRLPPLTAPVTIRALLSLLGRKPLNSAGRGQVASDGWLTVVP